MLKKMLCFLIKFRCNAIIAIALFYNILTQCSNPQCSGPQPEYENKIKELNAPLQMDSAYRMGVLRNGIRYIIISNDLPKNKTFFHAFYNIGAIQEESDQYGIAHAIEHICFEGKDKYLNYLKSNGLRYNYNAGTSMERTDFVIYDIPSNRLDLHDSSLVLLKELATNLTFKQEYIDNAKAKILKHLKNAEKTRRLKFGEMAKYFALKGTPYSRPVIEGDTQIINHLNIKMLYDFCNKWYRPDHLTIIAIGDFNSIRTESQIKQIFTPITSPIGTSPRIEYSIPDNKNSIIIVEKHPEDIFCIIEIRFKHPITNTGNMEQLRLEILDMLINNMLKHRYNGLAVSNNSPFISSEAVFNRNTFCGTTTVNGEFLIKGKLKHCDFVTGLSTLLKENNNIISSGFSESEFLEARKNLISQYSKLKSGSKLPSSEYFVQCYYYILYDKIPISIDYKREMILKLLPELSLCDINNRFKEYSKNKQPVIFLICSEKDSTIVPSTSKLNRLLKSFNFKKTG